MLNQLGIACLGLHQLHLILAVLLPVGHLLEVELVRLLVFVEACVYLFLFITIHDEHGHQHDHLNFLWEQIYVLVHCHARGSGGGVAKQRLFHD